MKKIKDWLVKQVDNAKFAWTIIVIVAALFGYRVSINPNPVGLRPTEAARVAVRSQMPEVVDSRVTETAEKLQEGLRQIAKDVQENL